MVAVLLPGFSLPTCDLSSTTIETVPINPRLVPIFMKLSFIFTA
jgi:hypothetical protein